MQKRGQVTLFIILGVVLIVIFGLVYYLSGYKTTKTAKTQAQVAGNSDAKEIVKAYAENCIRNAAENALFDKIGLQGGYLDPNEISSNIVPPKTRFLEKDVPYYLEATCNQYCREVRCIPPPQDCEETGVSCCPTCTCIQHMCSWNYNIKLPHISNLIAVSHPYCNNVCDGCGNCQCIGGISYTYTLQDISEGLAGISAALTNHIKTEFQNCFNTDIFKVGGISVVKKQGSVINSQVSINEEDISIEVNYPIIIKQGTIEASIESFKVNLPIRLKALYEGAKEFIQNIQENYDTPVLEKLPYHLNNDCQIYNKNQLTGIYIKNSDFNQKEIVQFMDYSNVDLKPISYPRAFIFQFAVKNVDLMCSCPPNSDDTSCNNQNT
ncbi:hypothetical protein HYX00_04925 [Candidatus Woesearchaeota archaeon]|nr:hypothetical protein [Candidatus Woesearchaeota archaeon]